MYSWLNTAIFHLKSPSEKPHMTLKTPSESRLKYLHFSGFSPSSKEGGLEKIDQWSRKEFGGMFLSVKILWNYLVGTVFHSSKCILKQQPKRFCLNILHKTFEKLKSIGNLDLLQILISWVLTFNSSRRDGGQVCGSLHCPVRRNIHNWWVRLRRYNSTAVQ